MIDDTDLYAGEGVLWEMGEVKPRPADYDPGELYSFVLNVNGEEYTFAGQHRSAEEAKEWAIDRLRARSRPVEGKVVHMAIFRGDGDEAEALGALDYNSVTREAVWCGAEPAGRP